MPSGLILSKFANTLSMQQLAVIPDLEGDDAIAERLRDQHFMRTCGRQSVRVRHIVGDRTDLAARRREEDAGRREAVRTRRIGVERSHVGVSVPGNGHVPQIPDRSVGQIGMYRSLLPA